MSSFMDLLGSPVGGYTDPDPTGSYTKVAASPYTYGDIAHALATDNGWQNLVAKGMGGTPQQQQGFMSLMGMNQPGQQQRSLYSPLTSLGTSWLRNTPGQTSGVGGGAGQ